MGPGYPGERQEVGWPLPSSIAHTGRQWHLLRSFFRTAERCL